MLYCALWIFLDKASGLSAVRKVFAEAQHRLPSRWRSLDRLRRWLWRIFLAVDVAEKIYLLRHSRDEEQRQQAIRVVSQRGSQASAKRLQLISIDPSVPRKSRRVADVAARDNEMVSCSEQDEPVLASLRDEW